MIITCPACQKKFELQDSLLRKKESVRLRCSVCAHIWKKQLIQPEPIAPPKDPVPLNLSKTDSATPASLVEERKSSRTMWLIYLITLVVVVFISLLLLRQHIVTHVPRAQTFYRILGIKTYPKEKSFSIKNLQYAKQQTSEGLRLSLSGQIHYHPKHAQARVIPGLNVSLYGKGNCIKQSRVQKWLEGRDPFIEKGLCKLDVWTFHTKDNLALPGEIIPFQETKIIQNPLVDPEEVVLSFTE